MSEEIKNKDLKKTSVSEKALEKVSGGCGAESEEEYTWSCPHCGYSITTVGYGYTYDNCPFCGKAVTADIPEDLPELGLFN